MAADDPARGDVVAVAVNRTSGARATWRWAGEAWQQVATTETPAIEPLTVTMAGDAQTHQALLVEEAFLGPDGVARGGTSTWDGSTWTHRPGPVPDDLISPLERPDSTEAIWATDRGRLVMLGGGSGDDAYRREWAWNGAAWQPVHG